MYESCLKCNKPLVCESNLWKIRAIMGVCVVGTGLLGTATLPLLGFGSGGVVAGSTAAAWQSSLGSIAAGSLFAHLQTLGATGMGILLFGGVGTALGLLGSIAVKLDWCTNTCDEESSLRVETINQNCVTDCVATYRLTVTNLEKLMSVRSPEFEFGGIHWNIIVFRNYPHSIGVYLHSKESCRTRMTAKIISSKSQMKSIRKLKAQDIEAHGVLGMNELVSWYELFDPENGFIRFNCITIEVEIKLKTNTSVETMPIKLECPICLEGIESKEASSIPCGHSFCSQCIKQTILEYGVCPLCMAPVTLNDIRRIFLPL